MSVAARFDAPLPGSALEHRTNPVTGALEVRYPLTWTGVRTYKRPDGRVTRELRRPEQVFAPSHLWTLRRLAATIGHPQLEDGTPVFLDARGGPGVDEGGTALRPAEDYQVGHTGDEIVREEIDGYPVPVAWCSVTAARAQRLIAAGALQSSLGYLAYLDEHDEPRTWDGPHGPEEYDVEHVLDHADPRVRAAIERGELPTVRVLVDGAETDVPVLGGNHLAIAIRAGRGAKLSEIRLDAASGEACCDACQEGHDEVCDGAGCVAPGAWSAIARTRTDAAAESAEAWRLGAESGGTWGGVLLGAAEGLPADLAMRDLSVTYDAGPSGTGGWLGYVCDGSAEDSPWIAFARMDGLLVAWAQRAADGAVFGAPCVLARDAVPQAPAGVAPAECAPRVSDAARADVGAYAAPASPPTGDRPAAKAAPLPHPARTLTVKKLTLPAKLDKTARDVAAALGAGAPARKADALEIELPEGLDPAMVLAALQAVCDAIAAAQAKMGDMEGQMSALEAAKAEADRICGEAMASAAGAKADADALRADAEEGRAVRLERVRAAARARIAGLTDADLGGDADAVRKAAIARWIPSSAPRLDSAPALVDSLWDALLALPELGGSSKPAPKPTPRADADDEPVKLTPSAPAARKLTLHNIDERDAR